MGEIYEENVSSNENKRILRWRVLLCLYSEGKKISNKDKSRSKNEGKFLGIKLIEDWKTGLFEVSRTKIIKAL